MSLVDESEAAPPPGQRPIGRLSIRRGALFAIAILALALGAGIALAATGLRMEAPWARASLNGVRNGIVYGSIVNDGPDPVRLVGGSTPVAGRVEFHIHAMNGDIMTMKQLDSVDLKPGETAILKPGGLHIMLVDLKQPLKAGESFPMTLTSASGASIAVQVKILGATALGPVP